MIRYALATKYGKNEREVTSWFRVACFANNGALRQKMLDLEKGWVFFFWVFFLLSCGFTEGGQKSHLEGGWGRVVEIEWFEC